MTRERVDRPDRNGRYRSPYDDQNPIGVMMLGGRTDLAGGIGFDPGASGIVIQMPTPDQNMIAAAIARLPEALRKKTR